MFADAPPTNVPAPSPRAVTARLTLELRAALRAADAAEASEASIDRDAMLARVNGRIAPLIESRGRALDEAFAQAQAEAAAAIAAAHREASIVHFPPPALPPINVVIDAEAFARVVGTVLGEQLAGWSAATPSGRAPAEPVTPKVSFWSQAKHVDVLLVGFATLIVLVIVASWLA